MTTIAESRTDAAPWAMRLVDRLAQHFDEPEWLTKARLRAWDAFAAAEMPSRVDHLWRYTDPQPFVPQADLLASAQSSAEAHVDLPEVDTSHLSAYAVWQGERLGQHMIDDASAGQGLIVSDLHRAASLHRELVEPYLGTVIGYDFGKFEALNAALWQAGLLVYVPRGVVIEKPVHLMFAGTAATPFFAPRILVVVEEGAQLTLIKEFTGPREARFAANAVMESVVEQGAHVRLVTVQRWGDRVVSHMTQRSQISRDAQVLSVFAGLGAGVSKADLGSILNGRGANVKLLGMSFGQDQQHFDHHTVHDHRAADSFSDLDFKVVLKDQARSAYTGLIRIEQNAPNCEAYQENRNLLLSDGTRADTIPELEILTDEVRCTHGATIGPLDPQEIFYLTARGIHRDEAIRMVVGGFVEPTLREIPEDLRERLRDYVMERVKEI